MKTVQPWQQIDERIAWSGWLKVAVRTYRMPDGTTAEFEVLVHAPQVVAVVALTLTGGGFGAPRSGFRTRVPPTSSTKHVGGTPVRFPDLDAPNRVVAPPLRWRAAG